VAAAMTRWRILALALGEKAHADPRIADRVALVRLAILCRCHSPLGQLMGGKVWSSEELATLELLAGDVPWPALPQVYWNTVRQHGYPRRTATALRRKCNDLGLQRAAVGRWVNAGLICQLMGVSYEAVQTWMRNGLIT
jgi:hypothetical protein